MQLSPKRLQKRSESTEKAKKKQECMESILITTSLLISGKAILIAVSVKLHGWSNLKLGVKTINIYC